MNNRTNKKSSLLLLLIALITAFYIFFNGKDGANKPETPKETLFETQETSLEETKEISIAKDGKYYTKDEVALYLHTYGHLPSNYLTKDEAKKLGWISSKGNLWDVAEEGVIGGDRFGNREGLLPENEIYYEADVNYQGGFRGSERLVYTSEGKVIYYTPDHYDTFEVIYD